MNFKLITWHSWVKSLKHWWVIYLGRGFGKIFGFHTNFYFRYCIRPFLRQRLRYGAMNNQFRCLLQKSDLEFKSFMRLTKQQFFEVLEFIKDDISTDGSKSRRSITPMEKLMVTLRYLVGGESHKTLSLYFMIGRSTISKLIPEVLRAIINRMRNKYAKVPNSENEWHMIERRFANRWNYCNTIGALDGKHVVMMKKTNWSQSSSEC